MTDDKDLDNLRVGPDLSSSDRDAIERLARLRPASPAATRQWWWSGRLLPATVAIMVALLLAGGLGAAIFNLSTKRLTAQRPTPSPAGSASPAETAEPSPSVSPEEASPGTSAPVFNFGPPPRPTGIPFIHVQMLTATTGWAMSLTNYGPAIWRTTTGPQHWTDVTPRGLYVPSSDGGTLLALDAQHAWLVPLAWPNPPKVVYRTSDGGARWASAAIPVASSDAAIFFTDSAQGWILDQPARNTAACDCNNVTVIHTSDGGASWQTLATSVDNPGAGQIDNRGVKAGISFRDPSVGYIGYGVDAVTDKAQVYRTIDGGKTWNLQVTDQGAPEPASKHGYSAPPKFFGSEAVMPVVWQDSSSSVTNVEVSHDGGSTWNRTIWTYDGGPLVSFINSSQGWELTTNAQNLYQTIPSGSTFSGWQSIAAGAALPPESVSLQFVNASTGFVLNTSGGGLYTTSDGGHSWSRIIPLSSP